MKPVLIITIALLAACPGGKGYQPPWGAQAPTAAQEAQALETQKAKITSFKAESVMDYWLGKDRVKGEVLVMGKPGAFVRMNALSPAGSDVMADLACDGANFTLVDKQNNCVLTGPCDETSIAQFLHVPLAPDDFFHLATGTTPVIDGPQKVSWDSSSGQETLELASGDATQTIVLDRRDGHMDVVSSRVKHGTTEWTLENKDFADNGGFRLPKKSRFQASGQKADLLVDWTSVTANVDIDPAKFQVPVPAGLPQCGAQPAPQAAPAPHP
jgi:hypothetical protein